MKRGWRVRRRRAVRRSPRQNRRGLIEANYSDVLTALLVARPLPGRIAGASLKPGNVWGERRGLNPSPRQNRRGLIEACMRRCNPWPPASLSPAESPGPH